MQQPTEMFAYWDHGNCSGPGSLKGQMRSTCHRKGRASSVIGSPRGWRGLLKNWCETGISINPSPTSLVRVDRSVVEHLRSSTWPLHYLHLLQFIMFEYHGAFSFLFCPRLSQNRDRMFLENSRGHRSRWGQACSPLILVQSSQHHFLCFALCWLSSPGKGERIACNKSIARELWLLSLFLVQIFES